MADLTAADVTAVQPARGYSIGNGYKQRIFDLTVGNGVLTYPTGGIPLPTLAALGFNKEIRFATVMPPLNGYVYRYDRANHKLLMFYGNYDAADGVLIEVPGASVAPASAVIRIKFEGE